MSTVFSNHMMMLPLSIKARVKFFILTITLKLLAYTGMILVFNHIFTSTADLVSMVLPFTLKGKMQVKSFLVDNLKTSQLTCWLDYGMKIGVL